MGGVMGSLEDVFTASQVMALTGPATYARGAGYHRQGRAELAAAGDGRVRAVVRGSVPYTVELWVDGGQPRWSCTCPAAEGGSFCKHCVALSLLLVPSAEAGPMAAGFGAVPKAAEDDSSQMVAAHVAQLDRERLVELTTEAAESDWRLRERLLAEARASRGEGPDLGSWRRRIEDAFAPYDDFVDYREAAGWADEVDEVLDAVEQLCDAGHADAVVVLAEHAHRCADQAIQHVDDSDGWLTTFSDRISELHLRACREGDPDPVELARRLVDLELTSELDGFYRAAATHAGPLGDVGLAEYRRLVEPRWRSLESDVDGRSSERFAVREAMVGLALANGDPDELIEVRRHDLKSPDAFLEIVRLLSAAARDDEAVTWARQGLDRFVDRPWHTPPLREFLAGLLRDRGEPSAVVELFHDAFAQSPSLSAYRRLLEEAGDDASSARDRALHTLRSRLDNRERGDTAAPSASAAALVEILAYEGDIEPAWQTAVEHGCGQQMWLTLARAREGTHPLDAIEVYEGEVFAQIEAMKNHTYRQAVDLLARIRRLAGEAEEPERFEEILDRVRTEHNRKRNLKKFLDAKGW